MLKSFAALIAIGILLGTSFTIAAAVRVDARADITNYLTGFGWRAPNSFEPDGHYTMGTAAEIVTNRTGNWTVFRNLGNLGIGNGSVATFGDPNSLTSNYSDYNFQAGDVSQQPVDPVRELNLNMAAPETAANNTTAEGNATKVTPGNVTEENTGNNTSNNTGKLSSGVFRQPSNANLQRALDIGNGGAFNNSSLPGLNNTGQQAANNTTETAANNTTESETPGAPAAITPENATFAAYHPIWAGQPVNDLVYEHPFATSISTYCRLVGLATPSGIPINIGMRCLSYGY